MFLPGEFVVRPYVGRFAPSPSGPLHFGSILTATASFLDARSRGGKWLVRIEDIDPPREVPGAADTILRQLDAHGLHWDDSVLYQYQRVDAYEAALNQLRAAGLTYGCHCRRARVQALGGRYDGKCKSRRAPLDNAATAGKTAIRLAVEKNAVNGFVDIFQGQQRTAPGEHSGDFVLRRRDQLWGYHLAVSVDDAYQQITHVIRGSDLLHSTPDQIYLLHCLNRPVPEYGHVPVVVDSQGRKLSKQNYAKAVNLQTAAIHIYNVLVSLKQYPPPELLGATVEELITWGTAHWQRGKVPIARTMRAA